MVTTARLPCEAVFRPKLTPLAPVSMFAVLLGTASVSALADTASPSALLQPGLKGEQPPPANETKVLKVNETETAINCTSTQGGVASSVSFAAQGGVASSVSFAAQGGVALSIRFAAHGVGPRWGRPSVGSAAW